MNLSNYLIRLGSGLRQQPGSSLLLVALLALSLALSGSIFSVVDTMLWKPLDFPNAGRLVSVPLRAEKLGLTLGWAPPYLAEVQKASISTEAIKGYREEQLSITDLDGNDRRQLSVARVEPGLLELLGAAQTGGRLLNKDDALTGAESVALLSADTWRQLFSGEDFIPDRSFLSTGKRYRVIGILPSSFAFPVRGLDAWLPLGFTEDDVSPQRAGSFGTLRAMGLMTATAKMPGAANEMRGAVYANSALAPIADQIGLQFPVVPLREIWLSDQGNALIALLVSGLLILFVSLLNLHSLFMLRTLRKNQYFALLRALGAPKSEIAGLVAGEGAAISLISMLIALLLVPAGIAILGSLGVLPKEAPFNVHGGYRTLAFLLVACAISALSFSMCARAALRGTIHETLRQTGNSQTGGPRVQRARHLIVVLQLGVTAGLLFGTILLTRDAAGLVGSDLGFSKDSRYVARIHFNLEEAGVSVTTATNQVAAWIRGVNSQPGIDAAGLSTSGPFSNTVAVEKFEPLGSTNGSSDVYVSTVSARYPEALGLRLLSGRTFSAQDADSDAPVALIDSRLARAQYGDGNPVGGSFSLGQDDHGREMIYTVIGVVEATRQRSITQPDEYPLVYVPGTAMIGAPGESQDTLDVVVHGADRGAVEAALQSSMEQNIAYMQIEGIMPMQDRVNETIIDVLRLNRLLGIFSAFGIAMVAVGMYSLMSSSVLSRRREFAIKLALGAQRSNIIGDVSRRGGLALAHAGLLAVPVLMLIGAGLRDRLHSLYWLDPLSIVMVLAMVVGLSAAANIIPTIRASRVSPSQSLGGE